LDGERSDDSLLTLVAMRLGTFVHDGHRLAYTDFGEGPRVTVLIHGLTLSQRMQEPLARELAERGNRVLTLDLLGHGVSEQPETMWKYSMSFYAAEVVALLDHLGIEQAVVGGTSLGANVTLEVAAQAPDRLRGLVVEMPVLDNALLAVATAFFPVLVATTFGAPATRAFSRLMRLVPNRRLPFVMDIGVEVLQRDPAPTAALLQGLFFGRVAPHRTERRKLRAPALVIGHRRDPIHPFSDAGMLADELPEGRLLEASSIIELRVAPRRLTNAIADFVDECWQPRRARQRSGRRAAQG
jgi:pimeloyl-ACP methyl ester carboxylesterase